MFEYPPPAFYFSVTFGSDSAEDDYSFQEVGGIGPEMDTESYQEGGENRFVYMLPKALKHPKLQLKRGIAPIDSPLVSWCKDVLEGGFSKPIVTKVVHVSLLNDEGNPLRRWSFSNAYPVNWSTESFNATKNDVAVEKIELSYDFATRETTELTSFAFKRQVLSTRMNKR